MTGVAGTSEPAGASEAPGEASAAAANVIRGDLPAAAGLANVWLELRKTLAALADPAPPVGKATRLAARPASADPLAADPLAAEPPEAGAAGDVEAE